MAVLRTLVGLAATALLIQLAMAANYTVGGPNGSWDSSTDLQTWVAGQKFEVGDNLIFQYLPNHDVLEVSKADYDNCLASSPIQTYNDGNTVIPLTAPVKRYFICGTVGHCDQGMKIEIDTLASSTPPPTTPPSTPLPSPAPKSSPSPANSPEPTPDVPSQSPEVPSSSPDVPSTESPGTSPSPSGLSSPPPPSSAYRASFQSGLTLAFGLVLMVLLAL